MKCPVCGKGTLKKGKINETMFGVYLGEFPAEICNKYNESFTDEKTTRAIEEAAKKKGIWGLGKKTKTCENQRFSGHRKSKGFSRVTKTGNSLAVRIPKDIADFLKLTEGKEAYMHPEKDRLIIDSS